MRRHERDRQAAVRLEARTGPVDHTEVPAEIVDPTPPAPPAPEPPPAEVPELDEPPENLG